MCLCPHVPVSMPSCPCLYVIMSLSLCHHVPVSMHSCPCLYALMSLSLCPHVPVSMPSCLCLYALMSLSLCPHVPVSIYALVGEIKVKYFFFILFHIFHIFFHINNTILTENIKLNNCAKILCLLRTIQRCDVYPCSILINRRSVVLISVLAYGINPCASVWYWSMCWCAVLIHVLACGIIPHADVCYYSLCRRVVLIP